MVVTPSAFQSLYEYRLDTESVLRLNQTLITKDSYCVEYVPLSFRWSPLFSVWKSPTIIILSLHSFTGDKNIS